MDDKQTCPPVDIQQNVGKKVKIKPDRREEFRQFRAWTGVIENAYMTEVFDSNPEDKKYLPVYKVRFCDRNGNSIKGHLFESDFIFVNDEENDPVNHPPHYADGKYEVIDFIESMGVGFHLANAVKYICRAGKKDPSKKKEDMEKAVWYVERYLAWVKDPVPKKIDLKDFIQDKGLDGTLQGLALDLIVSNNTRQGLKVLKMAVKQEEEK